MTRNYLMVSGLSLFLSGCLGVASVEEPCIGGHAPTRKACGKKKVKKVKKVREPKKPSTGSEGGKCDDSTTCDAGLACEAGSCKRDTAPKECAAGKVRSQDTQNNCCWPGQGWASKCVGKPTACPGELVVSGDECVCPAGKTLISMTRALCEHVNVPSGMVHVPAGSFRMGSESGEDDEKPVHEVYVSDFFIDTYEVTVSEYAACMRAGGCSEPKGTHEDYPYNNYGAPGSEKHPINGVDWDQAVAYCKWAGKRLPTEAEWEKAARGTDGRKYPWGNEEVSCRYAVMRDDGLVGCGKDRTWEVGSKPAGMSPYGAHDMVGNVWEWVSDWYDEDYYASSPAHDPKGPARSYSKVLRGGGQFSSADFLCGFCRSEFMPHYANSSHGFRCARSLD